MIKLTATAPIYSISPMIEVPSKTGGQPFQKRELLLDDSWTDNDNQRHANIVSFEFTGDKMAQLDQFYPGQKVTVEAYVNGRESNGRCFNTIRGSKVTLWQPQQQAQQQAPQQGYAPQQPPVAQPYTPQYNSGQPAYQGQPYNPPQYPGYQPR